LKVILELPVSNSNEFHYIVDNQFINDNQANGHNWNDFAATENSVEAF
jgi:hypothetical protein